MTNDPSMPLITVLMAEYNTDETRLRTAITSILEQTESRFELLIVDDGGSNDVPAIAADFDDARIRVIGYGENRGFVAALNFGWRRSRCALIARMDTDDVVEPNYLAAVHGFLQDHPEFSVVSGQASEFSDDGPALVLGEPGEVTARSLMRGGSPIHAASMILKDALEEVGGYPLYRRAEDLALWCELLLAGRRMYILPKVLYHYRVEKEDFSKRRLRHRRDEIRVRLHYYPKLGAGPREYLRVVKSVVSGLLPTTLLRWIRGKLHSRV